jgi:hypothetical protein
VFNGNIFISIITGISDIARVFHPVAVAISTHEDAAMFEFIGKLNYVLMNSYGRQEIYILIISYVMFVLM